MWVTRFLSYRINAPGKGLRARVDFGTTLDSVKEIEAKQNESRPTGGVQHAESFFCLFSPRTCTHANIMADNKRENSALGRREKNAAPKHRQGS